MIIRVRFFKKGYLKFLGHLDLVRLFTRAFTKAEIDVKYSEGFNPHPKFSIGNPLSLGIESYCEYMDIELNTEHDPKQVLESLNATLPKDIQLEKAIEVKTKKSLTSIIRWASYDIYIMLLKPTEIEAFRENIAKLLEPDELIILKKKKKGKRKIETPTNVRALIKCVEVKAINEDGFINMKAILKTGEDGNLKPIELVNAIKYYTSLEIDLDMTRIIRTKLYAENENGMYLPV